MRVIILDTGIDRVLNEKTILGGVNLVTPGGDFDDDNGHGSLCSSIIKLYGHSLPYWFVIKILNARNESSIEKLIEALDYTKRIGIRLINLSLSTLDEERIYKLSKSISELRDYGKIIVASAPNSGKIGYPASLENVIGVDGGIFSNQREYWYNKNYSIQYVANRIPVMVKGCKGEIQMFGGTSKATAVVTAIIGDILEEYPNISYEELQNMLMDSAKKKTWNREEIAGVSQYITKRTSVNSDEEQMIEEVVAKYLRGKGMLFDLNNLREWGYQGVLHGNDFMKILNDLEKKFNIRLPYYEGIDYRVFENANSLKKFLKLFV